MSRADREHQWYLSDAQKRRVYTSVGLPQHRRSAWRDIINDIYVALDIDIPVEFRGEIQRSSIARLELTEFVTDGEIANRRRAHIARDSEDFFLFELSRAGTSTYRQYGRECELLPNHFALVYTADPYYFGHDKRVTTLCLKIPSAAMKSRVADPHALCATARPVVPGLSKVTADLLVSLVGEAQEFDATAAPVMEANLLDMIGLILNDDLNRADVGGTSVRWAIHKRAMGFMKEALGKPDLAPDAIAAAIGISTRYLHRVFEDARQTVGDTLMAMRLDKCRDDLCNPSLRPLSIKEIAFRNGFKTQSHFASSFRARFGQTPKEARQEITR